VALTVAAVIVIAVITLVIHGAYGGAIVLTILAVPVFYFAARRSLDR
jgi:hypothetical protein